MAEKEFRERMSSLLERIRGSNQAFQDELARARTGDRTARRLTQEQINDTHHRARLLHPPRPSLPAPAAAAPCPSSRCAPCQPAGPPWPLRLPLPAQFACNCPARRARPSWRLRNFHAGRPIWQAAHLG